MNTINILYGILKELIKIFYLKHKYIIRNKEKADSEFNHLKNRSETPNTTGFSLSFFLVFFFLFLLSFF